MKFSVHTFKAITRRTSKFATLFDSGQRRLPFFSTLRRLDNPEDWLAMLQTRDHYDDFVHLEGNVRL